MMPRLFCNLLLSMPLSLLGLVFKLHSFNLDSEDMSFKILSVGLMKLREVLHNYSIVLVVADWLDLLLEGFEEFNLDFVCHDLRMEFLWEDRPRVLGHLFSEVIKPIRNLHGDGLVPI